MPRVFVKTAFEAIKFECQRCGSCCHHRRPQEFGPLVPMERMAEFWEKSNLIYLTNEDIDRISSKTGLEPAGFVDTLYEYDGRCVRVADSGKKIILDFPVMKSKADTTCVFYERGCTIYAARPRACRLFPFRVEEETTAQGDMILRIDYNPSCPGIGTGRKVDKRSLEKLVVEQFRERSEAVAAEVRKLAGTGRIQKDARVFRTLPGNAAALDDSVL
ncbi:MAG: Flagellin N-methylase [Methanosaeta sp. PtaU1.Bin060]|nr:MAG: Flagellin N-methylase [Methanosaeta sp. PtaU1.Bin060]